MNLSVKTSRLLHVDALKAIAAQLIVLHHLSAYGPVADTVRAVAPDLMGVLYHYGRMAVQVFLVVGGFLSARALSGRGQVLRGHLPELLWRRYLRLAPPFMAAVLLTLACSTVIEPWLPELVPESVSFSQLLAHGLLLHGVLGHENLTAGAWYVAVDFQLFATLAGLLWLARRSGRSNAVLPVLILGAGSLFVFNRMPDLDAWAPYFFGSYSLGVIVQTLSRSKHRRLGLLLLSALVVGALLVDFRERIVVAGVTALLLAWLQKRHESGRAFLLPGAAPLLARLGTQSYSLFLVHFPICLLANGLFAGMAWSGGEAGVLVMAAAWALSNLAALPFYRWIEAPSGRMRVSAWLPRLLRA